jgi:hypothetical protein
MLEVTVAIPYLGVVRSRGAGAGNEDLAARQGLDVGHRERRRNFEEATRGRICDRYRSFEKSRPLPFWLVTTTPCSPTEGGLAATATSSGPTPTAAGPLGWPCRSRCPCRRSGVIGSARTPARRWRLRSSRSACVIRSACPAAPPSLMCPVWGHRDTQHPGSQQVRQDQFPTRPAGAILIAHTLRPRPATSPLTRYGH